MLTKERYPLGDKELQVLLVADQVLKTKDYFTFQDLHDGMGYAEKTSSGLSTFKNSLIEKRLIAYSRDSQPYFEDWYILTGDGKLAVKFFLRQLKAILRDEQVRVTSSI